MQASYDLVLRKRFLPLFVTQFLGAFNDNLFKQATILLAVYQVYHDAKYELTFTGIAYGAYVLPFFLFSALGGQLADSVDKARVIRVVKIFEIGIMALGALGMWLPGAGFPHLAVALLVAVLFLMGTHSSFFGPTKYAILPQHLAPHEVLAGTSMVEAGTNVAVLIGIIVGGLVADAPIRAGLLVMLTALLGYLTARQVPPAPPEAEAGNVPLNWNIVKASIDLIRETLHVPALAYSVLAIAFFVIEASMLGVVFVPLVKNVLGADPKVATLMLTIFTIGVAIGAVAINAVLQGRVSGKYCVHSALAMTALLVLMYGTLANWPKPDIADIGQIEWRDFLSDGGALVLFAELLGVAIAGGMFVVPLYAILTTTLEKAHAARVIAANNMLTSAAGVFAAVLAGLLSFLQVMTPPQVFLLIAGFALVSAWVAHKLHAVHE